MRIGVYRFRPGFWPTLAVLLLLPLLLGLGFWQLDRAGQKRAWLEQLQAGLEQEPIELDAAATDYQAVAFRRVIARGSYDPDHQLLLDNQVRDRQVGYLVLTPLRLDGTGVAVLVDRGWVPAPLDRTQLPAIDLDAGALTVRGIADQGPSAGLRLGEAAAEADRRWPLRLQYLDFAQLEQRLPYPLMPYVIRLDADQPHGYRRDWQPTPEMGPATHLGYAVQWFGLAIALVVIYLVVNTRRMENLSRDR